MTKVKETIFKVEKGTQVTYRKNSKRLSADFSAEALQKRREWQIFISNVLKEKKLQLRIL